MEELTASEALFGFVGWLTTRKAVTEMSAAHDCAGIANLVQKFCTANGLAEPVNNWHEKLIHPPS